MHSWNRGRRGGRILLDWWDEGCNSHGTQLHNTPLRFHVLKESPNIQQVLKDIQTELALQYPEGAEAYTCWQDRLAVSTIHTGAEAYQLKDTPAERTGGRLSICWWWRIQHFCWPVLTGHTTRCWRMYCTHCPTYIYLQTNTPYNLAWLVAGRNTLGGGCLYRTDCGTVQGTGCNIRGCPFLCTGPASCPEDLQL